MQRRIVVTGMGLVTPLGCGLDVNWKRLVSGASGLGTITHFDPSDLPARVVGQVPTEGEGAYVADEWVPANERKKMDRFIQYGMAAAKMAVADAGWKPETTEQRNRTGVMIGSGIGGLPVIEEMSIINKERGPRRVSPFFIPSSLINLVSGYVSIEHGFQGPNHAVVTACASGAHAIGDAARLIMLDDADVMVAGGAESAICPIGIAGFSALRALSTSYNDAPQTASRPWDKGRDGFVMGEGSGMVVLEEYEHAKKRGARIYAELVGYGLSGDAYHYTAPQPEGDGAFRAMQMALKRSGLSVDDLDYVNAHGTSTPKGDEIELLAVKRLFGAAVGNISMSSTKSSIGHLLGAAGAVEAIYSIMAMRHQLVPPTLNLHDPSEECSGVDLVPLKAKERKVRAVLSNSFGFGGTNASLIFTPAP